MMMIHRCMRQFSTINAQYLSNRSKNAVRFQSQNINWDYQQLHFQSSALAKGLKSLNYKENDNILIRIPSSLHAEAFVAKLGSAIINANLILSKAESLSELDQQISNNKVKGIIFEPTLPLQNELAIDGIYQLMPEIKNEVQGSQIKVPQYPSLSTIFQTNFYSYPGIYKFRSLMNYASDENYPLNLSANHQPIALPDSNNPIVITNPAHDFAFRAGILNSVVNGRFIICEQASRINKLAEMYGGNIDLIGTEQVPANQNIRVFVQKNSQVMRSHGKRTQL